MLCRKLQVSKEWNVPSKFDNVALHTNHLKLAELNQLARKNGLPDVFQYVDPLPEDNGEVFLSEYFVQQQQRNQQYKPTLKETLCKCPQCSNTSVINNRLDLIGNHSSNTQQTDSNNSMKVLQPRVVMHAPPPPPPPAQNMMFCQQPNFYFAAPQWYPPTNATPVMNAAIMSVCGCVRNVEYHLKKRMNMTVRGKPPHDNGCPQRG